MNLQIYYNRLRHRFELTLAFIYGIIAGAVIGGGLAALILS